MKKVLGIGNALVDIMTIMNDDNLLNDFNIKKGSMQLVDATFSNQVLEAIKELKKELSSGGSAANTIHGLAILGIPTSFIGKTGTDPYGIFFSDDMKKSGINPVLLKDSTATGCAIALISPDSERTFATHLGAAITLNSSDLTDDYFGGFDYFYIEGYLVQNKELVTTAIAMAKKHGLKICLDLASYNVVEQNLEFLSEIINNDIDIVFANEEEAKAFTGKSPLESVEILGEMVDIAIVKTGANGSYIKNGSELVKVNAIKCNCIDTTGAGDAYAAGFIYGLVNNLPLKTCGDIGSLISGKVIEGIGAKISTEEWLKIKAQISQMK